MKPVRRVALIWAVGVAGCSVNSHADRRVLLTVLQNHYTRRGVLDVSLAPSTSAFARDFREEWAQRMLRASIATCASGSFDEAFVDLLASLNTPAAVSIPDASGVKAVTGTDADIRFSPVGYSKDKAVVCADAGPPLQSRTECFALSKTADSWKVVCKTLVRES